MADGVGGETLAWGGKKCAVICLRGFLTGSLQAAGYPLVLCTDQVCFSHHVSHPHSEQLQCDSFLFSQNWSLCHGDNWVEQFPALKRNSVPSVCWHSSKHTEKENVTLPKLLCNCFYRNSSYTGPCTVEALHNLSLIINIKIPVKCLVLVIRCIDHFHWNRTSGRDIVYSQ